MEYPSDKMVGFKISGEVTKEDYENVMFPAVKQLAEARDEINMVMVLDTPVKNFTAGAWMNDALLGLKNLMKWERVAIVSDEAIVKTATKLMNTVVPGNYKVFSHSDESTAFDWASGKDVA